MLKVDPYLVNGQHEITVNVIGAGGTGSLIVTKLARLNEALLQLGHPGIYVTLIDHDVVEKHNVGRQMFTAADINCYKADALISKINHAFGYDWNCHTRKFIPKEDSYCNILFSCVDNIPARKQILKAFFDKKNGIDVTKRFFIIDCGNARDYGQVIMTDANKTLKYIEDFAPDWDKQDTVEQQGHACSYLESLQEQDLFVNDWASMYAVQMLKELLFRKQLDYQGVFFNSSEFETSKIKINKDDSL